VCDVNDFTAAAAAAVAANNADYLRRLELKRSSSTHWLLGGSENKIIKQ